MVSVIVPNYNHAPFLRERIDSILAQSYTDFELILLDDCSTDNSRDILNSYRDNPHVSHIIFNEKNSGSTLPSGSVDLLLLRENISGLQKVMTVQRRICCWNA